MLVSWLSLSLFSAFRYHSGINRKGTRALLWDQLYFEINAGSDPNGDKIAFEMCSLSSFVLYVQSFLGFCAITVMVSLFHACAVLDRLGNSILRVQ